MGPSGVSDHCLIQSISQLFAEPLLPKGPEYSPGSSLFAFSRHHREPSHNRRLPGPVGRLHRRVAHYPNPSWFRGGRLGSHLRQAPVLARAFALLTIPGGVLTDLVLRKVNRHLCSGPCDISVYLHRNDLARGFWTRA